MIDEPRIPIDVRVLPASPEARAALPTKLQDASRRLAPKGEARVRPEYVMMEYRGTRKMNASS